MQLTLNIAPEEALLIGRLLRPRVALLTELLEAQVQGCQPGDASWASTADALSVAHSALLAVENACMEAGA